jgi:hypothetical protein
MHGDLQYILRSWAKEKPSRRADWRRLRGELWLAHAIQKSGLDTDQFAARFVHRERSRSNLVTKWLDGRAIPNRLSALQLEKSLPGTLGVFDLPFLPLLANRSVSMRKLRMMVSSYRAQSGIHSSWVFPDADHPRTAIFVEGDTSALLAREDVWGLFGIIALVREAEARGDGLSHMECCKDLYRALVPVVKIPWVRRSAPLLKSCVDAIRERVYLSSAMFDVDWSVIENHEDTQNSTNFILDAELVRGFEVRRRQMAKREKAIRRRARNLLKKGSHDV